MTSEQRSAAGRKVAMARLAKKGTLVVLFLALAVCAHAQDAALKAKYLNRVVTVKSSLFRRAILKNGTYSITGIGDWIPVSYVGKSATVIALQPHASDQPAKVNALGETVAPETRDFDLVIRFEDGLIAMAANGTPNVELPEEAQAKREDAQRHEKDAQKLLGATLYNTALSKVYSVDATIEDMADKPGIVMSLLQPLKVAAVKWNETLGCAVVKLELPGGGSGLATVQVPGVLSGNVPCANVFLSSLAGLTKADQQAIKSRSVWSGVSGVAVEYALGAPETENDYGKAGKQLVYPGGLIVYVSTDDVVTDIQHFGQ